MTMRVSVVGLAVLFGLGAGPTSAAPEPALRCQRAIERGGLRYARALLDTGSDCATEGAGPVDTCLAAALGGRLEQVRMRWEADATAACAGTDVDSALGYFSTCAGGPAACNALPAGLGCLACRLEQHVGTAVAAMYGNAPTSSACHAALARPGVKALRKLLGRLDRCLRRPDAISIAVCMDADGIGARL